MMRTAVMLLTLGFAVTAHGDTLDVANALRAKGCARATTTPLRQDAGVADIAKRWSGGGRLQQHIPSGYGPVQFVSKLQHEGFDGSTPAQRAQAARYRWRAIGENIAAGPTDAGAVVRMWLESPGHCGNIMSASFTEMGLGFADDRAGGSGVYWAQTFGRPR